MNIAAIGRVWDKVEDISAPSLLAKGSWYGITAVGSRPLVCAMVIDFQGLGVGRAKGGTDPDPGAAHPFLMPSSLADGSGITMSRRIGVQSG